MFFYHIFRMRDKYVDMHDYYVNMQHIYVDMQEIAIRSKLPLSKKIKYRPHVTFNMLYATYLSGHAN